MKAFALLLVILCAATTLADDKHKSALGTWTTDKVTINGVETAVNVTLVVEDGKYTVTIDKKEDKGTWTVDMTKKPMEMDIVGTEGVNKGRKYLAIYEIKDNKMTICYGLDDKTRPSKFESKKDSNTMLAVYKKK